MIKQRSKKQIALIVAAGLLLPFAPLLLVFPAEWIDVAVGDPMYLSKEMHMSYQLAHAPECHDKTCTVTVEISNNNRVAVHLDYYGTDGPGFAEYGEHRVFMIGKHGKRCQLSPDDSTDTIGSYVTRQVKLSCKGVFSAPSDIVSLELFGKNVSAAMSDRQGNL